MTNETDRKQALTDLLAKVKAGDPPVIYGRADPCDLGQARMHLQAAYLGSLDAAEALHEAVLPGFSWSVSDHDRAYISRHIGPDDTRTWILTTGKASPPARAWLIAIIEALIAEETQ